MEVVEEVNLDEKERGGSDEAAGKLAVFRVVESFLDQVYRMEKFGRTYLGYLKSR